MNVRAADAALGDPDPHVVLADLRHGDVLEPEPFSWLGALAFTAFLVQGITGALILFHYVPSPEQAYSSIMYVRDVVPYGKVILGLHRYGAYSMIGLAIAHLLRNLIVGGYTKPREITWLIGMVVGLLTLVSGFTGYLLQWSMPTPLLITILAHRRCRRRPARQDASPRRNLITCTIASGNSSGQAESRRPISIQSLHYLCQQATLPVNEQSLRPVRESGAAAHRRPGVLLCLHGTTTFSQTRTSAASSGGSRSRRRSACSSWRPTDSSTPSSSAAASDPWGSAASPSSSPSSWRPWPSGT